MSQTNSLNWGLDGDELLVNQYPPLPQLIISKVNSKGVQQALKQGRTCYFEVVDEKFSMEISGTYSKPRSLIGVPDFNIEVRLNSADVLQATLSDACRNRLQFIHDGQQSVPASDVGNLKKSMTASKEQQIVGVTSRKEFALKHGVSEEAVQNWCSICCIQSSLTTFNTGHLERLELYRRLSDARIKASDISLIFHHWR